MTAVALYDYVGAATLSNHVETTVVLVTLGLNCVDDLDTVVADVNSASIFQKRAMQPGHCSFSLASRLRTGTSGI